MATDKQLIEQIQRGTSEAFNQLFHKYQKQIYSVCLSILKNPPDAEEVVSDTFIHAYLKLDQLKNPEKFFAWLRKIAHNRSKDFLRNKRKEVLPLAQVSASTIQMEPDRLILKQELIDAIVGAIELLPPKDREVIQAHIDGMSHAEISEKVGISYQASRSRLYRARKKIKAHVKKLLNAIIGLPKMLSLEKVISGGIVAVKIGTSTKVTIVVTGVIVAGFIGFQIVTHQPDVKSSKVATQQQTSKSEVRRRLVSKMASRPNENEKAIQDEQYSSEQEIEEALTWLDSLGAEEPESENNPEQEIDDLEQSSEKLTIEEQDNSEKEESSAKLKEKMSKVEAEELWDKLEEEVYEYGNIRREEERLLSIVKAKYGDIVPATSEGIDLSNRYLELKRARREMFPDVYILAIKYANLTGQHEALSEGGWLHQFLKENRVVK